MSFDNEQECPQCGCLEDACECELDDAEIFDLSKAKTMSFESKDRKVATFRMTDPNGLCDMKIYLLICAKKLQMESELGIWQEDENGARH